LLGAWSRLPLGAVAGPTVPLAAAGFCIAAPSGLCMLATNASEYIGNPFLLIKFPAIALALANALALSVVPAWRARAMREPEPRVRRALAALGAVSLAAWLTAVAAGRLIGYW
jgi:hypothetical protein